MNRRMVLYTVGLIVLLEAALLLLPLAVGLIYKDESVPSILISIAVAAVFGGGAALFSRPKSKIVYAKEGFTITALAWLCLSLIGALPFYLSGQIPHFVDAFFETVSGFTTTGASVVDNVEALEHSLLMWRAFTHWIGGMGVLVLLTAFLPGLSERSIHILRAEMPGPSIGKFVPKMRDTAKILYCIYIGMTLLLISLLFASGMPLFDSLFHAFSTAGTGGFGMYADSAASLTHAQQWIIIVFMLLFGINFNLFYLVLIRRFRTVLRSTELWVFLGIALGATLLLCFDLAQFYENVSDLVRDAAFQASSVLTTTGLSTANYGNWPGLSKAVLLFLMFIGGSAGSTAGGMKVSRLILLVKNCHAQFRRTLHPRSVNILRFEGKKVDEDTQSGVMVYFLFYMLCLFGTFFFVSMDGLGLETSFSAAVACFNNVGAGFHLCGPAASYALFSIPVKLLLSFSMLLGRLEIWPLLILLYPATWRRRGTT